MKKTVYLKLIIERRERPTYTDKHTQTYALTDWKETIFFLKGNIPDKTTGRKRTVWNNNRIEETTELFMLKLHPSTKPFSFSFSLKQLAGRWEERMGELRGCSTVDHGNKDLAFIRRSSDLQTTDFWTKAPLVISITHTHTQHYNAEELRGEIEVGSSKNFSS